MLFSCLVRSQALVSVGDESHAVLEGPLHPARRGWVSNHADGTELSESEFNALRRSFHESARYNDGRPVPPGTAVRLLEKTPKNCLRIPLLRRMFPDAQFVVLHRDGRPNVSSLLEGWRAPGRFESYDLPVPLSIPDYEGQRWCFLLPRGWRQLRKRPLVDVAVAQWAAAVDAIHDALRDPEFAARAIEVHYEHLAAEPSPALRAVAEFLDLPLRDIAPEGATIPVINAVAPPNPEKWRSHEAELESALAAIAQRQPHLVI